MDKSIAIQRLIERYQPVVLPNGNIRTGPCRLSFENVFKLPPARQNADGTMSTPKYGCNLIMPNGAARALFKNAQDNAAEEMFGENWDKVDWRKAIKPQNRCRNKAGELYDGYSDDNGRWYIAPVTSDKPDVRDADMNDVLDNSGLKSGWWVLATVRAYAYPKPGQPGNIARGVNFGLQNLQVIMPDDTFGGGRSRAEDDFQPLDLSGETFGDLGKDEPSDDPLAAYV